MASKKIILLVILLVMVSVFTCGCFTATVHSKVNSDATIGSYKMEIETTQFVYNMLKEKAQEDGYSSIQSCMLSEHPDPNKSKYSESWDGDTVTICIESI